MHDLIHNFKNTEHQAANHGTYKTPLSSASPLLTIEQVADWLGTSKAWVRDHATRRYPRIPTVRLGGRRALLRFRPQDVETFITSHLFSDDEAPQ